MIEHGRLRLEATLRSTSQALHTVKTRLAASTLPDNLQLIELGLAEVLNNLVKHAFNAGDKGRINLHWAADAESVDLQITDCGRPIPRQLLTAAGHIPRDFEHTDLADLPESKFGLALVVSVFEGVEYRSRGGVNRLLLKRMQ